MGKKQILSFWWNKNHFGAIKIQTNHGIKISWILSHSRFCFRKKKKDEFLSLQELLLAGFCFVFALLLLLVVLFHRESIAQRHLCVGTKDEPRSAALACSQLDSPRYCSSQFLVFKVWNECRHIWLWVESSVCERLRGLFVIYQVVKIYRI